MTEKPETAWRTSNRCGERTFHVDEDCRVLKHTDKLREVPVIDYGPEWSWCPFCAGHLDGVDDAPVNRTCEPNLSAKLHNAESLDELRGGD